MYKVPRKLCAVSGNTAAFFRIFTGKNDIQVGAGLVAVRTWSMQAQYGTRQTGKRLATLKKYKKEPQDSFSTLTDRTPGCVTKMVESLKWMKWEKLEGERLRDYACCIKSKMD
jgi:hypothetical protein